MEALQPITDDELERLAEQHGPSSVEARVLGKLRRARRKDRQFEVFRVGDFYLVGPPPDGHALRLMAEIAEDGE